MSYHRNRDYYRDDNDYNRSRNRRSENGRNYGRSHDEHHRRSRDRREGSRDTDRDVYSSRRLKDENERQKLELEDLRRQLREKDKTILEKDESIALLNQENQELKEKEQEGTWLQEILNAEYDEELDFVTGSFSESATNNEERANIAQNEAKLKALEGGYIKEKKYRQDKINEIKKNKDYISKKEIAIQGLALKVERHTHNLKLKRKEYKHIRRTLEVYPSVQQQMNRHLEPQIKIEEDDEMDMEGWNQNLYTNLNNSD